jgi:Asp-tRNA(Asn)/Glu-tRNA(Gln) amidotransferase A subunit family amidase
MSSDLPYESLTTISDLIRRKSLSSVEVTDATLQRIAKLRRNSFSQGRDLGDAQFSSDRRHERWLKRWR